MHTLTATLWNTVIYETVEEEILGKTEVSEVVKSVKKVQRYIFFKRYRCFTPTARFWVPIFYTGASFGQATGCSSTCMVAPGSSEFSGTTVAKTTARLTSIK